MSALRSAGVVLLPLGYLIVALLYGRRFLGEPARGLLLTPSASWALRGLLAVHVAWLAVAGFASGHLPVANVPQALSVLALAVAAVYAFVEWHGNDSSTGLWLISLAFLFQVLASVLERPEVPGRNLDLLGNPFFAVHVSLALVAYAAFAVAAAYGALFLLLYRELKASRFALFFGRLPPLSALDRMLAGALILGLAALTGAAVVGAAWAQRLYGDGWLRDPTLLATLAIWLLYAVALLLRRLRRWQARETALASLAGLAAILFSLVAVNALFTEFHAFR
jgi:HemX protein